MNAYDASRRGRGKRPCCWLCEKRHVDNRNSQRRKSFVKKTSHRLARRNLRRDLLARLP